MLKNSELKKLTVQLNKSSRTSTLKPEERQKLLEGLKADNSANNSTEEIKEENKVKGRRKKEK